MSAALTLLGLRDFPSKRHTPWKMGLTFSNDLRVFGIRHCNNKFNFLLSLKQEVLVLIDQKQTGLIAMLKTLMQLHALFSSWKQNETKCKTDVKH